MRQTITWTVSAVLAACLLTGCTQSLKERIVLLEDANRSLTDQLKETDDQLASCDAERSSVQEQLATALRDADRLVAQLAERPEPEEAVVAQAAAPGWTPVPGGAMISIKGGILFESGFATLIPDARRTLDAIVSALQSTYADKDILVFGHTDSQKISQSKFVDNYQLSAERALAVVRYLEDRGVSPSRLVACGCGEHRPKVPNNTYANMTINRRVEIFAIDLE